MRTYKDTRRYTQSVMADMNDVWFVRLGDVEEGPIRQWRLMQLIKNGSVRESCLVWRPTDPSWLPAAQITDLQFPLSLARRLRRRTDFGELLVSTAGYCLIAAILLVGFQAFSYLREGVWPKFSIFDIVAYNLPASSSAAIHQPDLSAMREVHAKLPSVSELRDHQFAIKDVRAYYSTAAAQRGVSPEMCRFQLWLVAPRGWFGIHHIVVGLLNAFSPAGILVSVAGILSLIGIGIQPSLGSWDAEMRRNSR
jgi:hypothetical protein